MPRFEPFSDDELVLLADALAAAWRTGAIESGPDETDVPLLLDLLQELQAREHPLAGGLGGEAGLQALVRRAQAAG